MGKKWTGPPEGKHLFGFVTVGAKGQIVIPKSARDIYGIHPGDRILVLGDKRGMALSNEEKVMETFTKIMEQYSYGSEDEK